MKLSLTIILFIFGAGLFVPLTIVSVELCFLIYDRLFPSDAQFSKRMDELRAETHLER